MRVRIQFAVVAAWLLVAPLYAAANNAVRFDVSVRVVPNCRISVSDLAFGVYDPIVENATQQLEGIANLRVTCTKNARAAVIIEDGAQRSRSMVMGAQHLSYEIFSDPARTKQWQRATPFLFEFTGGSSPKELKVYGTIPPGQIVPAGWYTDTVTATVDF